MINPIADRLHCIGLKPKTWSSVTWIYASSMDEYFARFQVMQVASDYSRVMFSMCWGASHHWWAICTDVICVVRMHFWRSFAEFGLETCGSLKANCHLECHAQYCIQVPGYWHIQHVRGFENFHAKTIAAQRLGLPMRCWWQSKKVDDAVQALQVHRTDSVE